MKLLEVLTKETILIDLASRDKKSVLEELAAPVASMANISTDELVRVLMEREQLGSTGIGGGIGIPHGKLKQIDRLFLGFGLSRKGVNFDSMDGRPTHIFFLLLTPEQSTGLHLKILARISRLLKSDVFKDQLMRARDASDILTAIEHQDDDF